MYWTLELASKLEDAPWPATKDELIDYATRSGAPLEVIENLEEIEDEGEIYESIEDIWPDYPSKDELFLQRRGILNRTIRNKRYGRPRGRPYRLFYIRRPIIPVDNLPAFPPSLRNP